MAGDGIRNKKEKAERKILPSFFSLSDSPEVRAKESNIVGELGRPVSLSCLVEAYPQPNMVWRRDRGTPRIYLAL